MLAEEPAGLHRAAMGASFNRVMWGFLATFFVAVVAIGVYQVVWAWPGARSGPWSSCASWPEKA